MAMGPKLRALVIDFYQEVNNIVENQVAIVSAVGIFIAATDAPANFAHGVALVGFCAAISLNLLAARFYRKFSDLWVMSDNCKKPDSKLIIGESIKLVKIAERLCEIRDFGFLISLIALVVGTLWI